MSKLARMKISGIRSFGPEAGDEQNITFSSPVTLFLGQNGCGKTTIIEAIKYAITGDLPAGTRNGQGFIYDPLMANKHETRGQIKLKLYDIKGKSLTIQKISKVTMVREKIVFKNIDSTIVRDHQPLSNRCIDVHNEVCRSMGVPKAILNSVIFCHQEDSNWPLEEPKKLKERFDDIFDSTKYNKCIDRILKQRKQKSEACKLLKSEVEFKKINKTQMEKKRDQLALKEDRYKEISDKLEEIVNQVTPLQEKLENLYVMKRNVEKLNTQADKLKDQIEINQQHQNDILSTIKELDCSDEELENKISSFETDSKAIERKINELEVNKGEINNKETKLRNSVNREQVKLGQLQEEEKQNNKKINSKQSLIDETVIDFQVKLDNYDTSKSNIITVFKEHLQKYQEEIKDFETASEIKEKKLQDEIDDYRTKHVQLKQSIDSKSKQLSELKNEIQKVVRKLGELNSYDAQLQNLESRMSRTEKEIKQMESQVNVTELRLEIDEEKKKYENLEDQLQKVDKEVQVLQNYCSIQAELDVQNDNLTRKQGDVQKLKYKHETDFEHIFQDDIPENNIKNAVEKYLKKQVQEVNGLNFQINKKQRDVAKLEANLNVGKEKLKIMERELLNDSKIVDAVFEGEAFEKVEEELKQSLEELQTSKGIFNNSIQMYTRFIKSFKEEKPSCPVCMRDVKEKSEVTNIIKEIEKKVQDFPKCAKETETKLTKEQQRYNKILELKPTYYKIEKIKSKDKPDLIKNISELEDNLERNTKELNKLQDDILSPKKNQDLANSIMSDTALIDQYNIEIKEILSEISSLNSRMPGVKSSRNIQDALYEQENLKSLSKTARQKIETLTNKLSEHNERLQALKDRKNELKSKELSIKQELQGKDQLEIKRKETETKISVIENELAEVENDIGPMKIKLENALKKKEVVKMEDRKKRDDMGTVSHNFRKKLDEIITLNDSINKFISKNVDEQIKLISKNVKDYNDSLAECSDAKNKILKNIEDLKDQIINKKSYYRALLDNKKLREKRTEAQKLMSNYQELEKQLVEQDLMKIRREIQKLEEKISDLHIERSTLNGKQHELKTSIKEANEELSQPIYANAVKDYKKKFLEYKTVEKAVVDLTIFAKAIDWAMLQYHKQQMVYINETIRELWHAIYRGNDIDYIQIKTDMDTSKSSLDARRSYQYRLVQVKNDVELEMRGRCSAGQKVLASLVIRIALADTFSTKCGILALDEPTTNLDRENICSLCNALSDLITRKKDQENFQLLIITHDQEFLEKLSRDILIEEYYLVSRDEDGKSVVTTERATF